MKENPLKSFIRDTYKNSSAIPYIITGQVLVFVLLHVFELLNFDEIIAVDLYKWSYEHLSLPSNFNSFIKQPWSLFTHPFIYTGLFNILFDCLWLYWIGNIFLNFLHNRQFLTVFVGGLFIGGVLFLLINATPLLSNASIYWNNTTFGLGALMASVLVLVPNMELRLFLFGNVKLKIVAWVYLTIQVAVLAARTPAAAIIYLILIGYGVMFMWQLQNGRDWSMLFKRKKKPKHLKIVQVKKHHHTTVHNRNHPTDLPNQERVDQILDKISISGYDSLSSTEKEILFKASKQDQ